MRPQVWIACLVTLYGRQSVTKQANCTLGVRSPPIALPLARHRVRQSRKSNHKIVRAIRDAAVIQTPSDFAGIGTQIRARDLMQPTNFVRAL